MIMKSLKELLKEELSQNKFPDKMYHKSNPELRDQISKEGLKVKVGDSYKAHYDDKDDLEPLVFMYDKNVKEYDTTYDDDIWEIDLSKLDTSKIKKDPEKRISHYCYVYSKDIPVDAIKLIHKGTGEPLD